MHGTGFKQPTPEDLAHDFLWRVHPHAPGKGEVAIFNRSHYEDVLVVRVHDILAKDVWSKRYGLINDFEKMLIDSGVSILKFFQQEEQLERFKQRLDDPARNWKISESDYKEREYWDDYIAAFEDALSKRSTEHAPWFVIPANHKWFRNLAVSQIIAETWPQSAGSTIKRRKRRSRRGRCEGKTNRRTRPRAAAGIVPSNGHENVSETGPITRGKPAPPLHRGMPRGDARGAAGDLHVRRRRQHRRCLGSTRLDPGTGKRRRRKHLPAEQPGSDDLRRLDVWNCRLSSRVVILFAQEAGS